MVNQVIPVCTVFMTPANRIFFTNEQLRGFFGYFFLDDPGFHHHIDKLVYRYPLVQYKQVEGKIVVVGLGKYAQVVSQKIPHVDSVKVPAADVRIRDYDIRMENSSFEEKTTLYQFLTPWISFNESNYRKYRDLAGPELRRELERILAGNVLSFLKGCGIFADFRILPKIRDAFSVKVNAHGNEFKAFRGRFELNATLPDYIGLGKSVSKGFGTIRRVA